MVAANWNPNFRVSAIASFTTMLGFTSALFIFLLWVVNWQIVQAVFPGLSPVIALAFMLLFAANQLLKHQATRSLAQFMIFAMMVIILFSLSEILFGADLRVNRLFLVAALAHAPNIFSLNTAFTLILISGALLLPYTHLSSREKWSQLLLLISIIIAGIAFLGYVYDVELFYSAPLGAPMSFTSSILVLLLCIAIMHSQRSQGWMSMVSSSSGGGIMMRRVLPLVIIVPHLCALAFLKSLDTVNLPPQTLTAGFVIAGEVFVIGIFWWNSHAIDTADRQQAQFARILGESESRYRTLFEHSSDTILIADEAGRYVDFNPEAERLTGYTRDELLRLSISGLVLSAQSNEADLHFDQLKQKGYLNGEYTLRRKDGTRIMVEITAMRVGPGVYQSVLHDITAHKQVEENLLHALEKEQELNELKSRFVSLVSHEFRTPLSIIRSSTEMLLLYKRQLTESQRQERLENVQMQVNHMVELLEDVLTIGKADSVGVSFQPEQTELNSFCTKIIADFRLTTLTHDIHYSSPGTNIPVQVDQKLLRQALSNLISNAVKYSPNNNQIIVRLEQSDTEVRIYVQDFGIGIPGEDRERLFEYFHRARNVGEISGTGLGLAIVKQAVEAHGGTISCECEQGTTFTIVLPRNSHTVTWTEQHAPQHIVTSNTNAASERSA